MKILPRAKYAFLIVADVAATALAALGFLIPWEYSDRHQRRMKERINGKK